MKRLLIFCVMGTIFWLLYWLITSHFYPSLANRGLFGDSFGAFSSLATALAFSGTAYAIFKQDQLSVEQEKQIREQAELQTRTALALERNSTIELVNILERMRSDNAEEIATFIRFIKSVSSDPNAEEAVSSAKESLKQLFEAQGTLNTAHHNSIRTLVAAWQLPSKLADSVIATTKSGDYEGWAEAIFETASDNKESSIHENEDV